MAKRRPSEFKSHLSEKLMDLGNYILIALPIGQFVTAKEFSIDIFALGIAIAALCYTISYIVSS